MNHNLLGRDDGFVPSDGDEQEFASSSINWVGSLIGRHDQDDRLGVSSYDPVERPYQRPGFVKYPAFRPDPAIMETPGGPAHVQEQLLKAITNEARGVMGPEVYDEFVDFLASRPLVRKLLRRMRSPGQNSAALVEHADFLGPALGLIGTVDAMNRVEPNSQDFFDLTSQIDFVVSASLAFMTVNGKDAIEIPAAIANVIQVVPPTESSRSMKIDRKVRRYVNDQAKAVFAQDSHDLTESGRSKLVVMAHAASTDERVMLGSKLIGLRHKPINPMTESFILSSLPYVVPMSFWRDPESKKYQWFIGGPRTLKTRQDLAKVVSLLSNATQEMAGVPVTEYERPPKLSLPTIRALGDTAI